MSILDDLLAPAGASLVAAAVEAYESGTELAVGTRLRAQGHPADLVAAAFTQAELRRRAAAKFSRPDLMFFTRAGLEQASSERAARHRAGRFAGRGRLADLCTGIGGDLIALAGSHPMLAVDRDPEHLRMAVHNACAVAGPSAPAAPAAAGTFGTSAASGASGDGPIAVDAEVEIDAEVADVRDVDLTGVDGVFVDPARRGDGRRMSAGVCEPPLAWCLALTERVEAVAVKAAPGLPRELVPPGWEIEFVAERRGLKEAVLLSPALATSPRRATVLVGAVDVVTMAGEPDDISDDVSAHLPDADIPDADIPCRAPGAFLYDPNPAVTRAGLVGTLARELDAWQLDRQIGFLAADRPVTTPFARLLRVEADLPFEVRAVARVVRGMGVSAVDVRRRGLAGDVEAIRRRLLPARRDLDAGGSAVTVVMTRYRGAPWALVCTDVSTLQSDV